MTKIFRRRRISLSEGKSTKQKVANALMELAKTEPLDKITVRDISRLSGINRQTFYYHFKDKTELLNWVYETNFLRPYMQDMNSENWRERMRDFLYKLRENRGFVMNSTINAFSPVFGYIIQVIADLFRQFVISDDLKRSLSDSQIESYARFMAFGFFGTVGDWVRKDDGESPERLIEMMEDNLKSGSTGITTRLIDAPV